MTEPLSEQIIEHINHAANLYHRLVLVVAPQGAGKTMALRDAAARTGCRYINVNLELSGRLLDLPEHKRSFSVFRLLEEIIGKNGDQVVLLDNIELLFDTSLKQDPLRCLQGLSRHRTLVAAWGGSIQDSQLVYATPDHPEYQHYPSTGFMVASP